MTGMIANLALNVLIVVLLALTIGYCWLLNKRLRILMDSRGELAQLLKHFDESTERASESIIALQTASKKIGENIQMRIDKANFLIDDLSFMIDKGGKIANQLEASFAINRARSKAAEEPEEAEPEPIMQRPPEPVRAPVAEKPVGTNRERSSAKLEAVLERVMGRKGPPEAPPAPEESTLREPPRMTARERSKAEQELLEMIKAGIKG